MSSTGFNVFDTFGDYQVRILFQGWFTTTVWQFALSCLGLFLFTILFHGMRLLRTRLEHSIQVAVKRVGDRYVAEETEHLVKQGVMPSPSANHRRECNVVGLYGALFVLTTVQMGIWLLLMMANMTFNPWVFLSIILGYSVGDLAVHGKIAKIRSESMESLR